MIMSGIKSTTSQYCYQEPAGARSHVQANTAIRSRSQESCWVNGTAAQQLDKEKCHSFDSGTTKIHAHHI